MFGEGAWLGGWPAQVGMQDLSSLNLTALRMAPLSPQFGTEP